jgi:toxin ParE1/3/4
MAAKIWPSAQRRIGEIWDYTEDKWGEEQADKYVRDLVRVVQGLQGRPRGWRKVKDQALVGCFFVRHGHHYIFFRELKNGDVAVFSILHENMNFPSRLREDAGQSGE